MKQKLLSALRYRLSEDVAVYDVLWVASVFVGWFLSLQLCA